MHSKGKGLGIHEQGILEPIFIHPNQEYHGIDYKPLGNPYKDLTNTSTIFEEASLDIEIGSFLSLYDEPAATTPFIDIAIPTVNLNLSYPELIA